MIRSPLEKLCRELNITIKTEYGVVKVPEGWAPGTHPYKVTLYFGRRQLTTPFFCGPMNYDEPTAADVLSCLCLDAMAEAYPFEDWATQCGSDPDSRKAEAIYKECCAMAPRLRRFLGEYFEEIANAEH